MKKLLLAFLPALFLSSTLSVALAQAEANKTTPIVMATTTQSSIQSDVSPFSLVSLAVQGNFEGQGIPGNASLAQSVQSRRVTAIQLVQAGIKQNKLSSARLTDTGYLNSVEDLLSQLTKS